MRKNKISYLLIFMLFLYFPACDNISDPESSEDDTGNYSVIFENSVENLLTANCQNHDDSQDYIWESSEVIPIILNNESITVNGTGATVEGNKVTIVSAGTYNLSGTLADGQIIVNTDDEEIVRLIFNGVTINNSTSAPVFINSAKKSIIILADNSENIITDADNYEYENSEDDEPNAALFSKDDLTIYGNGSLIVNANYNDGITSKDGLIIKSGNITVNAEDDGIRGKDYLVIYEGNITLNADGDGLKSDNDTDADKGYILIENGVINISSGGDAITAETDVLILNSQCNLLTAGGSNANISNDLSAKGIKSILNTIIDNGTFIINSADDAIHSNGNLVINNGSFEISSGDDGVHADSTLGINGGEINITKSYEGIESAIISITGGNIHLKSSDDGLNVAGGKDGSGMNGWGGHNEPTTSTDYHLYISDGYIYIISTGDGIDVNGSVTVSGGTIIVNGPTSSANGALDYDATFKMTGGFLIAAGSSGMAQAPDASSTQCSALILFSTRQAGTLVHIQDSAGNNLASFSPAKSYQSIVFSSPELVRNATYDVYFNGSFTGTLNDCLYTDGTYTPGTKYTSFTTSSIVTRVQ